VACEKLLEGPRGCGGAQTFATQRSFERPDEGVHDASASPAGDQELHQDFMPMRLAAGRCLWMAEDGYLKHATTIAQMRLPLRGAKCVRVSSYVALARE
jgi:hypothetical protein